MDKESLALKILLGMAGTLWAMGMLTWWNILQIRLRVQNIWDLVKEIEGIEIK